MSIPIDLNGGIGRLASYKVSGNKETGGEVIQYIDGGFVGQYTAAFTVTNYVPSTDGSNGTAGGEASYGIDSYNWCNNGGKAKNGCMVGVQGLVTGDQAFAIGVSGASISFTPNVTAIGVAGVVGNYGANSIQVGVYAGINTIEDNGVEVKPESCALLIDNRKTGKPFIVIRKNNGESACKLLDFDDKKLVLEINGQKFAVKLEAYKP